MRGTRWGYGYRLAAGLIFAGIVAVLLGQPRFGAGLLLYAAGLIIDRPMQGPRVVGMLPLEKNARNLIGMLMFLIGTTLIMVSLYADVLS